MTTQYPGGIDNFTNPTPSDPLNSASVPHATQHANTNDAIEAIENELGVTPSGPFATVALRFSDLDTQVAGKAPTSHTHTIAQVTNLQSTLDYRVKGYTSSNQPASPVAGDIWVDPDDSSLKIWNGSAFVNPSNAGGGGPTWAVVSGGTVTEYTHPTYGVMQVHTFLANGSLVVSQAGQADILVISGGSGSAAGVAWGGAGDVIEGLKNLTAATHAITVGNGGANANDPSRFGRPSSIGTIIQTAFGRMSTGLSGTTAEGAGSGRDYSTSGSAVNYGQAAIASPRANRGDGANNGNGSTGIVIVAVKKP